MRIEHAKIDQKELLRMRQLTSAPPPLATLGVTSAVAATRSAAP